MATKLGLYCVLLIVLAFNLSSHTFAYWPGDNWWLRSAYWLLYLSLASSLIYGVYYLLEKLDLAISTEYLFFIAIVIAWLPFGLAISMVDIATGRPGGSYAIGQLQSTGFLPALLTKMSIEILPRHLMFGVFIYIMHFYVSTALISSPNCSPQVTSDVSQSENNSAVEKQTLTKIYFLERLSKAIRSEPQLLQAQEHYINVVTTLGQEMILCKFGQAIKEIPSDFGVQVHRSFWVAKQNIRGWSVVDNGLKVILHYGNSAPVSRRFEHYVKQNFLEIV